MIRQSSFSQFAGQETSITPARGLAAVAVAALLLAGCASPAPIPTADIPIKTETALLNENPLTQHFDLAPRHAIDHATTLTQNKIHQLFIESRSLVSAHTGANLDHIRLVFASDQEIGEEVLSETQRLITSQFTDEKFTNHFLDSVMSSQAGTYAALFATKRAEVMLSTTLLKNYLQGLPNDTVIRKAAVQALLIHELVHASDDVIYGIHENRKLNFRASFAQSATFEGHAQWLTRKLCLKAECSSGLDALDDFMFSRSNPPNQLTQSVQAVSRNVLEYSYIEGEHFMRKLAARPNGERLIEQLLTSPPQDPIQILDPASYPNIQREYRNQHLLKAAANADHQWRKSPWALVETSPLKGVNLRAEPGKRQAAIDGFTRLITSMVAAQLYDQQTPLRSPIDITIMQTDQISTAALFAQTLHENTFTASSVSDNFKASVSIQKTSTQKAKPPRESRQSNKTQQNYPAISVLLTSDYLEDNTVYYSVVSRLDQYVIQVGGFGNNANDFIKYSVDVLSNL